ncbi:MAG TPA: type VI secretion system tip protein TssI/VgrG [Polyangiaceae bacterium]|nr:type VI secretion system tip protein TssI/VgrG [Polyangiaceae bacterium]
MTELLMPTLSLQLDAPDAFDVRGFDVSDGLSELFSIEILARSANPAVDLEATVGAKATFRIDAPDSAAQPLLWSGVVSDIEQLMSEDTGASTYRIRLSPHMWLLTQRSNCRVFQQRTDKDIVESIFEEWGLPFESRCGETYKTRKYRVQYQETDYTFVSRLLEDAGISYLFEARDGKTVIVLTDAPQSAPPRTAPLEHFNEMSPSKISATAFRAARQVRPGRTVFADHDPRLPNRPLLGVATTSAHPLESRLESFAYAPGAFRFGMEGAKETPTADDRGRTRTDPDAAKSIAERDAAARIARSQRFSFMTNALDVRAGTVMKIANQPVAERHGALLVTHVSITGAHDSYASVQVDAVSGEVPYKPHATTPRPNISGVECATVVGPSGEAVHCDEFGRVRVQFHWDRYGTMDELSSCWIPVNQPWAGEGFGMVNLPRVGQEVLVSFLGGNPEEPVVVGRMFTNLQRPAFPLPEAKNESGFRSRSIPDTGGYNLLRFVDTAGEELVEGRAEKDMRTRVNHDKSLSVGRDRSMSVERDDEEVVAGMQRESVGKDKLSRVFDSLMSIVGKDRIMKTIGNLVSHAKTHAVIGDEVINISVGNSLIYIDKDKIVIKSDTVLVNPDAPQTVQNA